MITLFSELFNEFGNFGPVILFFFSIYLLWNQDNLFFYYVIIKTIIPSTINTDRI